MTYLSPKKILYVSFDNLASPKGATTHIKKFVEALKSAYQLTLLTLSHDSEDRDNSSREMTSLEFGLPNTSLLERVAIFREKLSDYLDHHQFDAIQFRSIWEGDTIAAKSPRTTKLIYEANGFPSIELKYHYPQLSNNQTLLNQFRSQEVALLLNASRIITPANVTKQFIQKLGINPTKIHVIPNGADIINEQSFDRPTVNNNLTTLIYCGTLAPWQGIDTLLTAFQRATFTRSLQLIIVGHSRKEWLKKYQTMIDDLYLGDKVKIVPGLQNAELMELLNQADLAIAPLAACDRNILQGCSPIKLFEYAAAQKAIIAPRLAVVEEIFQDRQNALLYRADDPQDLCEKILLLVDHRAVRQQLARAAYRLVARKYSWKQAQNSLLLLYQQLLSN